MGRQLVRRVLQQFCVLSRAINANRIPLVEVLEFYGEHGPLEAIHAVVIPDFGVPVFLALRVITERTRAVRYGCIVRDQSAAFSVRPEVLTRIKTKTRNLAKLTYAPPAVSCSVRLCGIFDHRQSVALCNRHD